jgi:hypothetical protein
MTLGPSAVYLRTVNLDRDVTLEFDQSLTRREVGFDLPQG